MDLRVGTSGYAYKEWLGNFYPEKLASAKMLAYYAERFSTVEINNTFYQLPKVESLRRWADDVPADFRFVLKASQRISHMKRLKDCEDVLSYLLRTTADGLGDRLGPVLFQLPPNMKRDDDRLAAFLALLPPTQQAAFEFRHASWQDAAVHALLRQHGAALCCADTDDDPEPAAINPTADWGYLRLRRIAYDETAMHAWVARLAAAAEAGGWREAYLFFKHEDEGTGPRFAAAFRAAWDARSASGPA
jgi:uncharacterized protein YecE (DUF72 family)